MAMEKTEEPWESKMFRHEATTLRTMICDINACRAYKRSFFFGICHECYKFPYELDSPLKRCSRCQLVYYCSTECQKEDWSSHKILCNINAIKPGGKNIFGSAKEEVANGVNWSTYCVKIMEYNSFALKRNLKAFEKHMFIFPRVCFVCKESDPALLTDCEYCYSVAYCSEDHKQKDKENHVIACPFFYMAIKCYGILIEFGFLGCGVPCDIPEQFQSFQNEIITYKIPESDEDDIMDDLPDVFMCFMSDSITYPLSIIYALEKVAVKLGKQEQIISEVQELTVHLVGARGYKEILGIKKWEYFLHQLPALTKLRVLFVGDELWSSGEHKNYRHEGKLRGCEDCQKKGRQVLYEESQMLYQEYVLTDYYRHPDVIVAFNPGFHCLDGSDSDTWAESLVEMTKDHTVPLIVTSNRRYETENDLSTVQHVNEVEILLDWSNNPFCSLYPMRHIGIAESDNIIAFSNSYITVVRGKKQEKSK